MIIALFPNTFQNHIQETAIELKKFLDKKNITVVSEDEDAHLIGAKPLSSIDPSTIDYIITLGGDGTILRTVHNHPSLTAPILGINLGHLGFMADVPLPDLYPSIEELLSGKLSTDERLILDATLTNDHEKTFAVNDIVIHRNTNPNIVEIKITVDGSYLNTFEADGIIIATPNGSTAYSLAAGGPILSPTLDAIVITPICPHTISNKPIVLPATSTITLEYASPYDPIEVRADGITSLPLSSKHTLTITKSPRTFKLVNLHSCDYFCTLRTKLAWVGKLRTYQ